jgi:uncharacterized protein YbjT (DUF2867 family)
MKPVIVAGGTGYLGRPLIEKLVAQGVPVTAIARPESLGRVPSGCSVIPGSVLDSQAWAGMVPGSSTFVHLVGTPHPAPWKGAQFRSVDLASLEQSLMAARHAEAEHFVFVSVAHPAPVMKAYIEVREQCEERIRQSGLNATILRPWYVLGPGHRWPYALIPVYRILESIPSTRSGAVRLGLVTRAQMVGTLARAVMAGGIGVRVLETEDIRKN